MNKVFSLLLLMCCLSSPSWAAEMVVIHANAAAKPLQVGTVLSQAQPVQLADNATVTLVFANGGVTTIHGPFNAQVTNPSTRANDAELVPSLSALLQDGRFNEPTLRARQQDTPSDIWLVDISTNKRHYCVAGSNQIMLWRPRTESLSASTLTIKHKSSGHEALVMWPAHQSTLAWPNSLPVVYGDTYTMELTSRRGSSSFKKLILYQLPDSLPTQSHKVVWMVGRGCIPQANMLLAQLR